MFKSAVFVATIFPALVFSQIASAQGTAVATASMTDILQDPTMGAVNTQNDNSTTEADIVWLHKTRLSRDVISVETFLTNQEQNQPDDLCSLQNGINYYLVTSKNKLTATGADNERWTLLSICVAHVPGTADYSIYIDSGKPTTTLEAVVTSTLGRTGLIKQIEISRFHFKGRLRVSTTAEFQQELSAREAAQ